MDTLYNETVCNIESAYNICGKLGIKAPNIGEIDECQMQPSLGELTLRELLNILEVKHARLYRKLTELGEILVRIVNF